MIKLIFLLAFFITSSKCLAQIDSLFTDSSEYYQKPLKKPDVLPQFKGGELEINKFIYQNVRYPMDAIEDNVDGTIQVRFTVTRTGKIIDYEVVSEKIGYGLEEAAIEVIQSMPAWIPGKLNGKEVAVYYTIPVKFMIK